MCRFRPPLSRNFVLRCLVSLSRLRSALVLLWLRAKLPPRPLCDSVSSLVLAFALPWLNVSPLRAALAHCQSSPPSPGSMLSLRPASVPRLLRLSASPSPRSSSLTFRAYILPVSSQNTPQILPFSQKSVIFFLEEGGFSSNDWGPVILKGRILWVPEVS